MEYPQKYHFRSSLLGPDDLRLAAPARRVLDAENDDEYREKGH